MKENKMLSLIADIVESTRADRIEIRQSTVSIQDIVKDLSETSKKAKKIGDEELHYLTSIALESAKEKLFLQMYENC
jgi:hypothetical protein